MLLPQGSQVVSLDAFLGSERILEGKAALLRRRQPHGDRGRRRARGRIGCAFAGVRQDAESASAFGALARGGYGSSDCALSASVTLQAPQQAPKRQWQRPPASPVQVLVRSHQAEGEGIVASLMQHKAATRR